MSMRPDGRERDKPFSYRGRYVQNERRPFLEEVQTCTDQLFSLTLIPQSDTTSIQSKENTVRSLALKRSSLVGGKQQAYFTVLNGSSGAKVQ